MSFEIPWWVGPSAGMNQLGAGLSGAVGNWNEQEELKRQLAEKKYAKDLAASQVRAQYGDFAGYQDLGLLSPDAAGKALGQYQSDRKMKDMEHKAKVEEQEEKTRLRPYELYNKYLKTSTSPEFVESYTDNDSYSQARQALAKAVLGDYEYDDVVVNRGRAAIPASVAERRIDIVPGQDYGGLTREEFIALRGKYVGKDDKTGKHFGLLPPHAELPEVKEEKKKSLRKFQKPEYTEIMTPDGKIVKIPKAKAGQAELDAAIKLAVKEKDKEIAALKDESYRLRIESDERKSKRRDATMVTVANIRSSAEKRRENIESVRLTIETMKDKRAAVQSLTSEINNLNGDIVKLRGANTSMLADDPQRAVNDELIRVYTNYLKVVVPEVNALRKSMSTTPATTTVTGGATTTTPDKNKDKPKGAPVGPRF